MAVQTIKISRAGLHYYIGLSTDTKPVVTTVPVGSWFWESDSELLFRAAASAWTLYRVAASVVDHALTPKGYEQVTGLSAVKALTVPNGAVFALIQAETQAVRWRDDGVNPSASVGMRMTTTDVALWYTGTLSAFRAIEETPSAKLNVSYYG